MDDVEIENQHEEEGKNRGEDHVEVGPEFKSSYLKGAGASEAGGQTKEGPLSKRYFQTSKIAQNRTKSPVPIVIDVFGVTAPYGNPYGSKIAIVWLFFVIF